MPLPDVTCRRCGRTLEGAKSRRRGIGPSCYQQEVAEAVATEREQQERLLYGAGQEQDTRHHHRATSVRLTRYDC